MKALLVKLRDFLRSHRKLFLWIIGISLLLAFFLYFFRKSEGRSLIIGDPESIVVITPDNSQDVIIIGDPSDIRFKPRKTSKK